MQLYLTTTPEEYSQAAGQGYRLAHLAYQIGEDGRLHRSAGARQAQNGLLSMNGPGAGHITDTPGLCRDILRECVSHGYEGVCADFGAAVQPDRAAFLEELSGLLHRSGKRLFVSAAYGSRVTDAFVLINTALSGGTLSTMLSDACHAFGAQRVAMDIERVQMDFLLPSPTGEGTPLRRAEFEHLQTSLRPSVFFSDELCAKYFTYRQDGKSHFVLFDDADTIRCKLKLARRMELRYVFLLCSEVSDLLSQLR